MPTGYTAALNAGDVPFPEFVLRCARAFGPLVTIRDDALDAPIPDRINPSKYHLTALEEDIKTLVDIESWNAAYAGSKAGASYKQALECQKRHLTNSGAVRKRYESMMQCVEDWTPPTPDHVRLKDFMLKQLIESIRFDCLDSDDLPMPKAQSGQEYKQDRLCKILADIEYHAKEYREELERSQERTEWLRSLRSSLE